MLPEILLFAHFKDKPCFLYEVEAYSSSVLFILKSGCFEFLNPDGQWISVNKGEAVFCPKDFPFHRRTVTPIDLYMIKFESTDILPLKTTVVVIGQRTLESLEWIPSTFCTSPDIPLLTKHYCVDVCIELCGHFSSPATTVAFKLPIEVQKLLNKHYTEDITNDTLCNLMHCSEATMIAAFKKATKKTPQQFITKKRLKLARRLLTETDESIGNIAEKCGFFDPLYFSRLFKNHTGLTASDFRKKYKI